eukprot:Colp12_sorted_trinity150504_noHs@779
MADKDPVTAETEEDITPKNADVLTKYKTAADITNRVIKKVADACIDGATVLSLCQLGDQLILEETAKVFNKGGANKVTKGIGFPTCISVNNCICHYSPLVSEATGALKTGDLVKIDLGSHIDGFIAVSAHTLVVGASEAAPVTGRAADVINAAHFGVEAALRLLKADAKNTEITTTVQKIAETFKCKPVEGMLSHQLLKNKIDGEKTIIQNPSEAQRKEVKEEKFEVYEVYGIDVLVSTGDGKTRDTGVRTTVFKKTDGVYQLKMKVSRAVYSEVGKKFTVMPFTLRALEDEKNARMGIVECQNHSLMTPFKVLHEKDGELVAQFKLTAVITPNGTQRITNSLFTPGAYKSEFKIEDEALLSLLASSTSTKNKKKKKAAAEGEKPAEVQA